MSDFDFDAAQRTYLDERRAELADEFGEDAVEKVLETTRLFADLIAIGSDNIPKIKAGIHRVAELVNEMLPRLRSPEGITRGYTAADMGDSMEDIPIPIQEVFLGLVGDVLLNSKGGPFETATALEEAVDRLAVLLRTH